MDIAKLQENKEPATLGSLATMFAKLIAPVFKAHRGELVELQHRAQRHAEHLARLETRVAALERERK